MIPIAILAGKVLSKLGASKAAGATGKQVAGKKGTAKRFASNFSEQQKEQSEKKSRKKVNLKDYNY